MLRTTFMDLRALSFVSLSALGSALGLAVGCGGALAPTNNATEQSAVLPCGRTKSNPHPGDAFATLKYAVPGTWRGTATTPDGWVPQSPYAVEITFHDDGTYVAQTTDASGGLPFYYDRNPESDRYELLDVDSAGQGSGNLYLEWLGSPDDLRAIRVDSAATHLHFEYYHFEVGPVVYELDCGEPAAITGADMTMLAPSQPDLGVP